MPSDEWEDTYGISSDGTGLTMKLATKDASGNIQVKTLTHLRPRPHLTLVPCLQNVGGRTYLMDGGVEGSKYKMFKLKNREFTFDVDVSQLPCGLNGALYFVEMQEDGGLAEYPGNNAGASFGTGYCDAQVHQLTPHASDTS